MRVNLVSRCPERLPLLGSNQDSPDPESGDSLALRGVAEQVARQFPPVSASCPTIPHTIGYLDDSGVWSVIVDAFDGRCAYCGVQAGRLFREHMIPILRGGEESVENIVPSCSRCNTQKGRRTPLEWFLVRDALKHAPRCRTRTATRPCPHCRHMVVRRTTDRFDVRLPIYDYCASCGHELELVGFVDSPLSATPAASWGER